MKQEQMSLLEFVKRFCKPAMFLMPVQQALLSSVSARKIVIPMVLHCPHCGVQHIDAPEPECGQIDIHTTDDRRCKRGKGHSGECMCNPMDKEHIRWINPPHRKHLCKPADGGCGRVFEPAKINTNGVKEL